MRVLVTVERQDRHGNWVTQGQPGEQDGRNLRVFLPSGRVRVRFTNALTGREQVTDPVNNVKPRWVRPGRRV